MASSLRVLEQADTGRPFSAALQGTSLYLAGHRGIHAAAPKDLPVSAIYTGDIRN